MVSLTCTTDATKTTILRTADGLNSVSQTRSNFWNSSGLWKGLQTGMDVFTRLGESSQAETLSPDGNTSRDPTTSTQPRLSAVFLLTCGNSHIDPPGGLIPTLQLYLESQPSPTPNFTIHTFGFVHDTTFNNYQLLHDIASVGNGTHGLISDCKMARTVFAEAVANVYTTYAPNCEVSLELADQKFSKGFEVLGGFKVAKSIQGVKVVLGPLLHGRSRCLVVKSTRPMKKTLTVLVRSRLWSAAEVTTSTRTFAADDIPKSVDSRLIFHKYRLSFTTAILSHRTKNPTPPRPSSFFNLFIRSHSSSNSKSPTTVPDLIHSINRTLNAKSISSRAPNDVLALASQMESQVVGTGWQGTDLLATGRMLQIEQYSDFKNPAFKAYVNDSPLFIKWRNIIDKAFEDLPIPTPAPIVPAPKTDPPNSRSGVYSGGVQASGGNPGQGTSPNWTGGMNGGGSTASFGSISIGSCGGGGSFGGGGGGGSCFAEGSQLLLSDGSTVSVELLRRGMHVKTPMGRQTIAAVVRTYKGNEPTKLCTIAGLKITPGHPIKMKGNWVVPSDVAEPQWLPCKSVYSVLLEPNPSPDAHAVWVGGVLCVTLGHGLSNTSVTKQGTVDARSHPFWGNYGMIVEDMAANLAFYEDSGVLDCYGTRRSSDSGQVCGFQWVCKTEETIVRGDWQVHSLNEVEVNV